MKILIGKSKIVMDVERRELRYFQRQPFSTQNAFVYIEIFECPQIASGDVMNELNDTTNKSEDC